MKLKTFHISHSLQWLQQDLLACARQIKTCCTGWWWKLPPAWFMTADFSISPPPRKGSHSEESFSQKKTQPGAVSHSDSTARGNGQSTENATAGRGNFATWVGARTQHKGDFLLERLKNLTYSTVNKTVLLNPRVWRMVLGYWELLYSSSARSRMGSKDHTETWWREEKEEVTE